MSYPSVSASAWVWYDRDLMGRGLESLVVMAAVGSVGCGPGDVVGEPETFAESSQVLHCSHQNKVDILIVMDHGPAMWSIHPNLVANLGAFIDVLESPGLKLQYRIAVTTTSVESPACDPATASDGTFETTSCQQRAEAFVPPGDRPDSTYACGDACSIEQLEFLPTATHVDAGARSRPWIERLRHQSNVPAGADPREALACLALQGFHGCRFSSPLEAARLALERTQDPGAPEYGFFRPEATAFILFIAAGHDCSAVAGHESIFSPGGSRSFWSDPAATEATPAVCWNAGVACTGGPGTYDECHTQSYGPNGQTTDDPGVLMDVSEYVERFQEFEDEAKGPPVQWNWINVRPSEIGVSVLTGVPQGYVTGQDMVYQDTLDPTFQETWGIGPGCSSAVGEAPPPVRLREFGEAFEVNGERNLHSLCSPDYTEALGPLAERLAIQLPPGCFDKCVLDQNRDTPALDPLCTVVEHVQVPAGTETRVIVSCEMGPEGPQVPAGAPSCWVARTDRDEFPPECFDRGANLQIQILRGETARFDAGCIEATCQVSRNVSEDCPNLG